ncbi:MAG TPA: hypothetical protein VHF22_09240, partial [Planctomycetota bacterium]|nr:hypothetical protein [Planctomycetota bacterium]
MANRLAKLFPALLAALWTSSCASPPPPPEPPPPPGIRPGCFAWREIRGDHDRLDEFKSLRDRVVAIFEEAARFPGQSGQPSPAAKEIPAIRAAFDDQHAPEELSASIAYFQDGPYPGVGMADALEGVELTLRRAAAKSKPVELTLVLSDGFPAGPVDGKVDGLGANWSPARVMIGVRA